MTIFEYMRLRLDEADRIKAGDRFDPARLPLWAFAIQKWEDRTPHLAEHHKARNDTPQAYDFAAREIREETKKP